MAKQNIELATDLINREISPENYGTNEKYQNHIFDQYRMYVEMADRISQRRSLANTFFLTINTFFIGTIGFILENGTYTKNKFIIFIVLSTLIILCYVWRRLIESYRQLNNAKFKIIGDFEKLLPTCPYSDAEWEALGSGKDSRIYRPFTTLEKWVPVIFGLLYFLLILIAIF